MFIFLTESLKILFGLKYHLILSDANNVGCDRALCMP